MIKEEKIFSKVLVIVSVIFILNFINLVYKYKISNKLTGLSIGENAYNFYETMPQDSKIFLFFQWSIIFFLLLYIAIRERTNYLNKKESIPKEYKNLNLDPSNTDLDSFYSLLKIKKEMELPLVEKIFKISPTLATEWSKLLVSGNLATLCYDKPGGEPVIKIREDNIPTICPEKPIEEPVNKIKEDK